ncbi:MAG: S8 family serine peptidase, partial [Candidatus Anstonellaceae archaeon]
MGWFNSISLFLAILLASIPVNLDPASCANSNDSNCTIAGNFSATSALETALENTSNDTVPLLVEPMPSGSEDSSSGNASLVDIITVQDPNSLPNGTNLSNETETGNLGDIGNETASNFTENPALENESSLNLTEIGNASLNLTETGNETPPNLTENESTLTGESATNLTENQTPAIHGEDYTKELGAEGRFASLTWKNGKKLKIATEVLSRLENNETARVIVKHKPSKQNGAFKSFSKSPHAQEIEVLELNSDSLFSLADLDAAEIYPDTPMSALLTETLPLIGADRAHDQLHNLGNGVTVCLLDTGVDFSLPSLEGRAVSGFDFINNDSDASDDNGHGTRMASIIHAVAPNATILSVKVLNENGTGYSSDIIAGIDYCRQLASGGSIKILSMSFGGGQFSGYCDEVSAVAQSVNDAVGSGLLAVAAAGNTGGSTVADPACATNATAVSSTTKVDAVSSFSGMNAAVDLLAPGENVVVNGEALSGTSVSAAHVSGAAALLFESNSSLLPLEAEYRFKTTGKFIE